MSTAAEGLSPIGAQRDGWAAHRRLISLLLPGVLLVLVPLLVVGPMLGARLGPIDDHEIPSILAADPLSTLAARAFEVDRFRPGWWVFRIAEIHLWSGWAPGMYLDRLLLLSAALGAAFVIARRFMAHAAVAAVAATLVVAGPQAEAWYHLGIQEALATPLLLGGVALILGRRVQLGLLLLVLASLTKESFIPFAFAAAFLAIGRTRPVNIVAALAGIALIALPVGLIAIAGRDMYGLHRTPEAVLSSAGWSFASSPAMWIAPVALILAPRRWAVLGAAFWLGSVFIYAGAEHGHYLLPGALVGAAATGWLLSRDLRGLRLAARGAVCAVAAVVLVQGGNAVSSSQETRDWQDDLAVARTALDATPDATLVVSLGDWGRFEAAIAVQDYLPVAKRTLLVPPDPPVAAATLLAWATSSGYAFGPVIGPCVAVAIARASPYPCDSSVIVTGVP